MSMCQKRNIKCHQSAEDRKRTTLLPDLLQNVCFFCSTQGHPELLLSLKYSVFTSFDYSKSSSDRRSHYMTKSTQTLQLDHRLIFTARKRSLGQGNVFKLVCHSVHRDGGGFPACITGHMTRAVCLQGVCIEGGLYLGGLPPGGLGRTPPPHGILRDMINKRAVRILLECILVYQYVITDIRKS